MSTHFDLCVVGGGILGAGIAQAAAINGLSTIIVEKRGWGSGNSSKSGKLVGPGLEYMAPLSLLQARERLVEREILFSIAPDLVEGDWFYVPIYSHSKQKPWRVALQLALRDCLSAGTNLPWHRRIPEDHWRDLTGLNQHNLRAVFALRDAQAEDAQLTQEVLRSAKQHGAMALCPVSFDGAQPTEDGYQVRVTKGSRSRAFDCRFLVNAAGAWGDQVKQTIGALGQLPRSELIKSTYIEFREPLSARRFSVDGSDDGSRIAIVPWRSGTLVGGAERAYSGSPDRVETSMADVDFLTNALRYHFPHFRHAPSDAWSGLKVKPLTRNAANAWERRLLILENARYLGVYGAQFGSYRAVAEKAVIAIMGILNSGPKQVSERSYISSASVSV
jgi:glycerol-3-phosphate dehydrogenase